jgi:undecaprenyl-diphosphatase
MAQMTIAQAVLLGALQGLTEFLPISSDGHLVVVESLLGLETQTQSLFTFDIILHIGSLIALLLCYRETWMRFAMSVFTRDKASLHQFGFVILATLPAVVAGFLLKDVVVFSTRSVSAAAFGFLGTALVLVVGEWAGTRVRTKSIVSSHAFAIGCAQAVAILPGLSRSGLTIGTGRALGVPRREALDFSFLLAAPAIFGAATLTLLDAYRDSIPLPEPSILVGGFLSSFVVSLSAITFLRWWVASKSIAWFAVYLVPLAIFLLLFGG